MPDSTTTTTTKVANPPAGGPQEFASTNDDNQNTVLQDRPWLVVVSANGQIGVQNRFASEADASAAAAALRAGSLPNRTDVVVKKEADLPAYLAEVEGAYFGTDDDSTPSETKAATTKGK